jgi:hypothetical protein
MNHNQLRKIARRIGVLNMQKKALEEELKGWKDVFAKHAKELPTTITKSGNVNYILDNVEGFTCKVYEKTQLYASTTKARELLHPNTFNAIFTPSTFDVVDVRPDKRTQALLLDTLLEEIANDKVA